MNVDIYKTYSFDFDKSEYMKNLRKALADKGITKPAEFDRQLKIIGVTDCDYETVKSYFYGRRAVPLNIFVAICKYFPLCADEIAFPKSVHKPGYGGDIFICEDLFRHIFFPYNQLQNDSDPVDFTEFFNADTYESDVDHLALILSKYNYLIQKYHYASVSNDEFAQIYCFTKTYIVEKQPQPQTDCEEVIKWFRSYDANDFLNAFYNKYTLGFYNMRCDYLLNVLKNAIPDKFTKYAEKLLPVQA